MSVANNQQDLKDAQGGGPTIPTTITPPAAWVEWMELVWGGGSATNSFTATHAATVFDEALFQTWVFVGSAVGALVIDMSVYTLAQSLVDVFLAILDTDGGNDGFFDISGSEAPTDGTLNANYLSLLGKGWTIDLGS